MRIKQFSLIWCVVLIIFSSIISIEARGGRGGGGGSRGGGSRGGSWGGGSKSSGGWFGSSRSSPSYSRPSPSYTYSAPSPSYSAPSFSSPSHSAPSYGWNVNSHSTGTHLSSNSPSSSYGWNVGGSSSSNFGSSSSGFGNTASKPSYGWNVGNTAPVGPPPAYPGLQNRPVSNSFSPPAYSPSFNNPPAYNPGHFNSPSYGRPVSSFGSSSGNTYRTNSYNTYSSGPSYYNRDYGNAFGRSGLGGNTYISNNYYSPSRSSGSGFLTNALFYGAGMHHGHSWGSHSHRHHSSRHWDRERDRRWRATTRSPYFENKVPGETKILPASAVIGAATAFGLVSLLPLNVPANKPLMYCDDTELMQAQIRIENGFIYNCVNKTIAISCVEIAENVNSTAVSNGTLTDASYTNVTDATAAALVSSTASPDSTTTVSDPTTAASDSTTTVSDSTTVASDSTTVASNSTTTVSDSTTVASDSTTTVSDSTTVASDSTITASNSTSEPETQLCQNRTMTCADYKNITGNIYCMDGGLYSKKPMFCNSTIFINGTNENDTIAILNCYEGELPNGKSSFIPTTTPLPTTTTTTEKSLSLSAKMHLFFINLIGRSDVLEKIATTTPEPDIPQQNIIDDSSWTPEALTIPPETAENTTSSDSTTTASTTTTERPFKWMMHTYTYFENGTLGKITTEVPERRLEMERKSNEIRAAIFSEETTMPSNFFKMYITEPTETTTSMNVNSTVIEDESTLTTTTATATTTENFNAS